MSQKQKHHQHEQTPQPESKSQFTHAVAFKKDNSWIYQLIILFLMICLIGAAIGNKSPRNNTHGLSADEIQAFGILAGQYNEQSAFLTNMNTTLSETAREVHSLQTINQSNAIPFASFPRITNEFVINSNSSPLMVTQIEYRRLPPVYLIRYVTNEIVKLVPTRYPVLMKH